jgi:excisionase family DNA binding protein
MAHTHATPQPGLPRLLDVGEVAALLGKSRTWVYRGAESGALPAVHVGRSVRFDPDDLARWLDARRVGVGDG